MWTVISKIGLSLLGSLVGNIFGAEGLLGAKKGAEKQQLVLGAVSPIVSALIGDGSIKHAEGTAIEYVKQVIAGIVALFNLMGVLRSTIVEAPAAPTTTPGVVVNG